MSNIDKKEIIQLISYMMTSARGLIDEPKIYGPFRMIDSVVRLHKILKKSDLIDENLDKKLSEVISQIENSKYECMEDENKFIKSLDDIIENLVDLFEEDI